MAEHTIPTPPIGLSQWLLRREFDAGFHRIRFRWNERVQSWYIDVANDENERQVYGVRLGTGDDKLRAFKARDVPQGSLNVVDSTGQGLQPTRENFGKTVQLKYVDAADVVVVPATLAQPDNLPAPPFPPGPDPALHGETHENEGIDEVRLLSLNAGESVAGRVLTYVGDNTAAWLPPALIENSFTNEVGTTKVLQPDASGGVQWNVPPTAAVDLPSINLFDHNSLVTSTGFQAIDFAFVRSTPDSAFFTQPSSQDVNIETAGRYLISGHAYCISVSPGANDTTLAFLQVAINGSTLPVGLRAGQGTREDALDSGHMAVSGELVLAVDDLITLRVRHDAASDVGALLQLNSAGLTLVYLGPAP